MGGGNRGHAIRLIIPFSVRPMNTSSRFVLGRALLVAALVVGCKESTGPAGPRGATTLTVQSGDEQHALAGSAVALPLKVLVTDDEGDPVADVLVSFAVKTGGGTITGGAARTDDAGVATAGVWTLGAFLGEHTVEASVSGLESVTFTANARCTTDGALALDATVTGTLVASDCKYPGGELTDRFVFTTTEQRAVRFAQRSLQMNTYLEVYDDDEGILAFNNDSADVANHPASTIKMLLAPGTYEVSPSAFSSGETGGYSLSATAVPESSNSCTDRIFAMRGITTIAELATGDCVTAGSPSYLFERYFIVMHAGQTYTISMNSTSFDTYLEIAPLNGQVVTSNDDTNGTNARITFTPTVSNFYVIFASSSSTGESGAYTLIIQ